MASGHLPWAGPDDAVAAPCHQLSARAGAGASGCPDDDSTTGTTAGSGARSATWHRLRATNVCAAVAAVTACAGFAAEWTSAVSADSDGTATGHA